jgi:hypothetical protein
MDSHYISIKKRPAMPLSQLEGCGPLNFFLPNELVHYLEIPPPIKAQKHGQNGVNFFARI